MDSLGEIVKTLKGIKRFDDDVSIEQVIRNFKAYWVGENLIRIDIDMSKSLKD